MSTFAVTIEEIAKVWTHPNADLLEMAQLSSMTFQFVIGKGQFKAGDQVVYFPVDSLLPVPIIEKLGLAGKLSGKEKNRVKTVRLRDQISQGVVASPVVLLPAGEYTVGQDVTDLLGVTKYEAPLIPSQAGNLVRLPDMVSVYDIEGAERFAAIVADYLMDQPVMITEKLEGSHFAASLLADDRIVISQRNYAIEPVPGKVHDWHKVAQTSGLIEKLPRIKAYLAELLPTTIYVLTVRGEVLGPGVQKNIYKLPDHRVLLFELEVNGTPLDATLYRQIMEAFELDHAPVLAYDVTLRDWLNGQALNVASNGKSQLHPETLREGIVIRPLQEARDSNLGRVIIKQRSPEYLAQSEF